MKGTRIYIGVNKSKFLTMKLWSLTFDHVSFASISFISKTKQKFKCN